MTRTAVSMLALNILMSAACGGGEQPSVLLVIIDTVPAEHVGYCGYHRNTTPCLDSLAEAGAGFLNCQAQSPWTLPSCVSIVSGLNVRSHGARRYEDEEVMGIGVDLPTLQMVLNGEGYATGGFTNSYLVGQDFGWHRGFDIFYSEYLGLHNAAPTVDSCLSWLGGLEGQPYFALVHFFDPHDPYDPYPPWDTLFGQGGEPYYWNTSCEGEPPDPALRQHLIDMYDGGLADADNQLGRLLAGLRSRGLAEQTLVVVVADHGEEFLEHGFIGHGKTLFQELLHVPLVLAGPGVPTGEVSRPVAQVDVVPTLVSMLGIEWPGHLDGSDLFRENPESLPVFSSNLNATPLQFASVLLGSVKTVWEANSDLSFSFNLLTDPEELHQLPADSAGLERIHLYWTTPREYEPLAVDKDFVQGVLHDLGYI